VPSAPEAPLPRHLEPLDALRGVAVSLVFFQHLGDRWLPAFEIAAARLPAPLAAVVIACVHHAHVGVDLFFVLSGFSLAYGELLAAGKETSVLAFYKRRILRIFPAYMVATALVVFTHPMRLKLLDTWQTLLGYLFVVQGYVELPSGFIGASWSLTTEIHAYILFPFLFASLAPSLRGRQEISWRRGRRIAIPVLLATCFLAWGLRLGALMYFARFGGKTWWLLELTQHRLVFVRLDQFALGAAAAVIYAAKRDDWKPHATLLLGAGIVSVILGACVEEPGWGTLGYAGGYPLVSIGMAAIVLGATLRNRGVVPLARLGRASYGFFLNHQWVLGLTTAAFGRIWWGFVTATSVSSALLVGGSAFLFSYVAGELSRRHVEERFLKRRNLPEQFPQPPPTDR
jgi:peptidoglycan/LPS O-acetylase OafA/YrhL